MKKLTVKKLMEILSKANPDAELNFKFNPSNADVENCDIDNCKVEIFGEDIIDELDTIDIILLPPQKSSGDFETIHELLGECKKVVIEMNEDGLYVFGDDELRRECDFKLPLQEDRESLFVKKLIEIL